MKRSQSNIINSIVIKLSDYLDNILELKQDFPNSLLYSQILTIIESHWEIPIEISSTLHGIERKIPKPKNIKSKISNIALSPIADVSITEIKDFLQAKKKRLDNLKRDNNNIQLNELLDDFFKEGMNYAKLNENEIAEQYFQLVLENYTEKDDNYVPLLDSLASVTLKQKRFCDAAQFYSKILQLRPIAEFENKLFLLELYSLIENISIDHLQSKASSYFNRTTQTDGFKSLAKIANSFIVCDDIENGKLIYQKIIETLNHLLLKDNSVKDNPEIFNLYEEYVSNFINILNNQQIVSTNHFKPEIIKYQNSLATIRNNTKAFLNQNENKVRSYLNDEMISFIQIIIEEATEMLGLNIDNYAIIGLGSMARRELAPYSDIELMIITKDNLLDNVNSDIPRIRQCFKALIELIKIKVIALGETASFELRIKPGFCYDKEHFSNISGKANQDLKLIGTVNQLLVDIKGKNPETLIVTDFVLRQDTILLFEKNGKDLLENYRKEISQLIKTSVTVSNQIAETAVSEQISIKDQLPKWLEKELVTYKKKTVLLYPFNDHSKTLDIKNDLMRFPMFFANRIYHYISSEVINNGDDKESLTIKRLDNLALNFLDQLELAGLKEWIHFAYILRVKSHLEAGYEEDKILLKHINTELLQSLYNNIMQPIFQKTAKWIEAPNKFETNSAFLLQSNNNNVGHNTENQVRLIRENIANIYLLRSKELMKKYHDIKNHNFLEQANWYFEKAAEMSLDTAEHWWHNQLLEVTDDKQTNYSLEFIDNSSKKHNIIIDKSTYSQFLDEDSNEIEGTRIVKRIYHNGNYFHCKYLPEMPGIEYAVSSLSHLICGYTTAPFSILAKLTDRFSGGVTPILISRSVIGEKLSVALEKNDNIWRDIDSESFSLAFLRTILTNPEDDQLGNFIIQKTLSPDGETKSRIFCIDNDHGFLTNTVKKSTLGYETIMLKSILYCAKEKMEEHLHAIRVNNALTLDLNNLLEKWLKKLIKTDENNRNLFEDALTYEEVVEKHGKKNKLVSNVTMMLEDKVAVNIYYKLMQIKNFLGEKGVRYSYIKLLSNIDLVIGTWYKNLLLNSNLANSKKRFEELSKDQYTEIITVNNQNETMRFSITQSRYLASTLAKQPSPKEIRERKYSPHRVQQIFQQEIDIAKKLPSLRDDFINNQVSGYIGYYWNNFSSLNIRLKEILINGQLPGANIKGIKNNIFYSSSSFKHRNIIDNIKSLAFTKDFISLNLSNLTELTNADLEYILPASLKWLDISNCSKLNEGVIDIIFRKCPELETLYIGHNSRKIFFKTTKIFNTLLKLNLNDSTELNDKDLLGILTSFTNIKTLEIANCINIKSKIFETLQKLQSITRNKARFYYYVLFEHDIYNAEFRINNLSMIMPHEQSKNLFAFNPFINSKPKYKEKGLIGIYRPLVPLYAKTGDKDFIEILIRLGVNVNEKLLNVHSLEEVSALMIAADRGDKEIVQLLIDNKADVNAVSKLGYMPLMFAAAKGREEIVHLLIKAKANINYSNFEGQNAINLAIEAGNTDIAKILITHNPDINAIKIGGETILMWSIKQQNNEILQFIIKKGIDINPKYSDNITTPLIHAVILGYVDIINLLLDNGANPNTIMNDGTTALSSAVKKGHKTIVKILIKKGANIDQEGKDGKTPLLVAVEQNNLKMIKYLIIAGVKVNDKFTELFKSKGYEEINQLIKVLRNEKQPTTWVGFLSSFTTNYTNDRIW